jgi:hypothetical protein
MTDAIVNLVLCLRWYAADLEAGFVLREASFFVEL